MLMPTVAADSAPPDSRSVVLLFLEPSPRSACRFICECRVVPVRVSSFPVGFSAPRGLRSGLVCEAPRVVLRGFVYLLVYLPLFVRGTHYAFYLFFTTQEEHEEEVGQSHSSRAADTRKNSENHTKG